MPHSEEEKKKGGFGRMTDDVGRRIAEEKERAAREGRTFDASVLFKKKQPAPTPSADDKTPTAPKPGTPGAGAGSGGKTG